MSQPKENAMYKAVASTRESGILAESQSYQTAAAAINAVAREVETGEEQRVRIGVLESDGLGEYREIFWSWGDGIKHAAQEARVMDKKSRAGNGR